MDAHSVKRGFRRRRRSRRPALPCRRRERRFQLSPLNRRRWQNFKPNRRGYWSLWIFLVLFILSLFAEFIANDKPFMIRYRRPLLFPGGLHLFRKPTSAANSKPRRIIAIPSCRS